MLASFILAAAAVCVHHVHDGDSLTLCGGEKIRIANVDTPEVRGSPRCQPKRVKQLRSSRNPAWCDHDLADRSRDELRAFLGQGRVVVHRTGKKSYGRSVATVTVNGRDAGEHLISRGLARRWR